MNFFKLEFIAVYVVVANLLSSVKCWDSEELELFDLVEEVNTNFYTLLGVVQNSDSKTIRHAFRNLSLKLHPDKNDAPDADIKFRQLVAVHEVLRDPVKRKRYDEVLENGLPDWRHPVYYYRRVRKMGLAEMLIIVFTIVTIGQYIVSWAAYLEKKYIVEEFVSAEKKRLQKKQKKGKLEGNLPDMTIAIPKPSLLNTLPFQIPKLLWVFFTCIPLSIKLLTSYFIQKKKIEVYEAQEESDESEPEVLSKGPRRRRNFMIPQVNNESKLNGDCLNEMSGKSDEIKQETQSYPIKGGLWTDDDLSDLIKYVNKYPPGMNKRWEKIAEVMNRSVGEVIITLWLLIYLKTFSLTQLIWKNDFFSGDFYG